MIFKRRREIERWDGDGLISSELRDKLRAQENRSNKFSRNSGMKNRTKKKVFQKRLAVFICPARKFVYDPEINEC